jgi:DnaJ-class molecular chaperone
MAGAQIIEYCKNNEGQERDCSIDACPCCGGLGVAMRCPSCGGAGAVCDRTKREAELAHVSMFTRCDTCNGRGYFPITVELFERMGFDVPGHYVERQMRKSVRRAANF